MPKTKKGKKGKNGAKTGSNKNKSAHPDIPAPDKGVNNDKETAGEDSQAWNNYNPNQQEILPNQHSENQSDRNPLTFESEESK